MSLLNINNIFNLITGRGRETKSAKDSDVLIIGRTNSRSAKGFTPSGIRFKDLADSILKKVVIPEPEPKNYFEWAAKLDFNGAGNATITVINNEFAFGGFVGCFNLGTGIYSIQMQEGVQFTDPAKVSVFFNRGGRNYFTVTSVENSLGNGRVNFNSRNNSTTAPEDSIDASVYVQIRQYL